MLNIHVDSRCQSGGFATEQEWKAAKPAKGYGVQMQWDPDHSPAGGKLKRRAIQLGMSPDVQNTIFNTRRCIHRIDDITEFVAKQRERLVRGGGGAGVGPKRKPRHPVHGAAAEAEHSVDDEEPKAAWRSDPLFVVPIEKPYEVSDIDLARRVGVSAMAEDAHADE